MFVMSLQIGRVNANDEVLDKGSESTGYDYSGYGNAAGSYGFSIIQITDTQSLSESFPALYTNLTNWIVANNADYNVKMVIHTGDIVNQGEVAYEWDNANSSMSILLDAGIPYTWDAGNHDQNLTEGRSYSGTPNGGWLGSSYLAFNATYMRSKSYWVSDINDGKDTAVEFASGNYHFLVINLEFHANQTAINWMTNLINTHPNYKVIVATHSYLNGIGEYGYPGSPDTPAWENALTTTLNNYPNVFLALSGHYVPVNHPGDGEAETANNTRVGNREEIFFNRQHVHGDQGAYAARIYTFNMTDETVQVTTNDLYSSTFKDDSWNRFAFSSSLSSFYDYPASNLPDGQLKIDYFTIGNNPIFSQNQTNQDQRNPENNTTTPINKQTITDPSHNGSEKLFDSTPELWLQKTFYPISAISIGALILCVISGSKDKIKIMYQKRIKHNHDRKKTAGSIEQKPYKT